MSDEALRDLERKGATGDVADAQKLLYAQQRLNRARLAFFVAQAPSSKGNSKQIIHVGGKPRIVSKKKDKQAENSLTARVLEFRPPQPLLGPLRLDVTFVVPMPNMPAWKRAAAIARQVLPTARPDRGNMLKLIEDVLEGPFYVNDTQIVDGRVAKVYGEIPGYEIVLEQIAQPETKEEGTMWAAAAAAATTATARPAVLLDPAITVECPACMAVTGAWCLSDGPMPSFRAQLHDERLAAAEAVNAEVP